MILAFERASLYAVTCIARVTVTRDRFPAEGRLNLKLG